MKTFITLACALVMGIIIVTLAPNALQAAVPTVAEKVVVPEIQVVLNPWFDTAPRCYLAVRAPPLAVTAFAAFKRNRNVPATGGRSSTIDDVGILRTSQGGISALCAWWHQVAFQTYPMLC